MYELLLAGIVNIAQFKYLIPLFMGTLIGVIGGALPGVTITMTIIVVLPFTYGLDPLQGLAAMTGVYVGGSAGGLVTATLLGIPGTPSAIANHAHDLFAAGADRVEFGTPHGRTPATGLRLLGEAVLPALRV